MCACVCVCVHVSVFAHGGVRGGMGVFACKCECVWCMSICLWMWGGGRREGGVHVMAFDGPSCLVLKISRNVLWEVGGGGGFLSVP